MHTIAPSSQSDSLLQVFTNVLAPWHTLKESRGLIASLARREVRARFAGTLLGGAWTVISPLIMLAIYSFVFGVVFKGKWGQSNEQSLANFALIIFCSISAFAIFQECLVKAPSLVISQPNLVKRVVFPTETLVLSSLAAALFQALINFTLVICALYVLNGAVPVTVLLLPVMLLPLVFMTLGAAWLLASLGVFFRDIQHIVGLVANALLFLTPIFFSLEMLPSSVRFYAELNPLAPIIEGIRDVVLWGEIPNLNSFVVSLVISWCVMQLGYAVFMRLKPTFADVI
ncbi:MAG: ABC transporter permease [Pseudomonadota bacterium]|jgi:lipopolysaccharide transport system permease protein